MREIKVSLLDLNLSYTSNMKMSFALLLACCMFPALIWAQVEENPDTGRSPYELMSSYYSNNFKPFRKGNFYTGLSFSLSDKSLTNVDQIIQKVITGNNTGFNMTLKGGYYTGDYGMAGINFTYEEEKFNGMLLKDADTIHSQSITRAYSFTPNVRSSVPLTENERLSFFTEVGLLLGVSNGLTRNTKNIDEIEKVYTDNFNLRLGISPGITFFAMENFAFEVQLDVLGYELQVKNKEINGIEQSKEVRHNVDFNIDILSLKLGLAYYFGRTKKQKQ
jgi:hypothetical protein